MAAERRYRRAITGGRFLTRRLVDTTWQAVRDHAAITASWAGLLRQAEDLGRLTTSMTHRPLTPANQHTQDKINDTPTSPATLIRLVSYPRRIGQLQWQVTLALDQAGSQPGAPRR